MAFILNTATNPGTASWTAQNWIIAETGVVTFGALSPAITSVTIPVAAGLEGSPVLLSWANDVASWDVSGGRLNGSVTGTTLTINVRVNNPDVAGLKVAYTVLRLTV